MVASPHCEAACDPRMAVYAWLCTHGCVRNSDGDQAKLVALVRPTPLKLVFVTVSEDPSL
jgi:hypothetical protein